MEKIASFIFAFLLPLLFTANRTMAQSNERKVTDKVTTITGIVTDKNGKAIPDVTIISEQGDMHAVSDAEGHFSLNNLPVGEHKLKFTHLII